MSKWPFFLTCCVIILFSGCAKQQHFTAVERICVGETDKAAVMQRSEEVLGEMRFAIAKFDAESGVIRTRPLSGAQFFEFWRKDTIGKFNRTEANLHTVRRTVDLDISEQNGQVCVGCNAKTERLSISGYRGARGGSQKYNKFSGHSLSTQKLGLKAEEKAWLDLGRDARLETEILKQIEKRIAAGNN